MIYELIWELIEKVIKMPVVYDLSYSLLNNLLGDVSTFLYPHSLIVMFCCGIITYIFLEISLIIGKLNEWNIIETESIKNFEDFIRCNILFMLFSIFGGIFLPILPQLILISIFLILVMIFWLLETKLIILLIIISIIVLKLILFKIYKKNKRL